ncbi:carboxypeptidase-like regulatory domain-containing protein [Candidatus Saganbacteria bacterium]|uniref:Carboxypeptidase-like regulatory domain-containing protein n=1 Tax=Candidatus Saganbacteria bacterium TaxID=2575572 RepID=A0A9D6YVU2_UNCSA|nr:carboxypeptidase-like regulatory domain-containing protein [Candidatus Saganbacteria bacterium]
MGEGIRGIFFAFVICPLSFVIFLVGCGDIVGVGEVSTLTVSPPSATIGVGNPKLFSVVAKDSMGRIVQVNPTWSVEGEGSIGTISSSGLFTAGTAEGAGNVVAVSGSLSAKAAVTITAKGWVEGKVTDEIGKRVEGIKVYLKDTSLSDFTDSNGDYSISYIPAGTYEVWTLENAIYKSSSQEASVGRGETVTKNFLIYYFTKPPDLTPPTL